MSHLVLHIRDGERLHVGDAVIWVERLSARQLLVNIEAPREVLIDRESAKDTTPKPRLVHG